MSSQDPAPPAKKKSGSAKGGAADLTKKGKSVEDKEDGSRDVRAKEEEIEEEEDDSSDAAMPSAGKKGGVQKPAATRAKTKGGASVKESHGEENGDKSSDDGDSVSSGEEFLCAHICMCGSLCFCVCTVCVLSARVYRQLWR